MALLLDIPKYAFGTSHVIDEGSLFEPEPRQLPNHPTLRRSEFKELVKLAVELGCRHFDCAPLYGTQQLLGQCFREIFIQKQRRHFFITSKLPPNMMQDCHVERSIYKSIQELQCGYLDLLLVHAPFGTVYRADDDHYPTDEDGNVILDETDQLLENALRRVAVVKARGYTRFIGVSNVNMKQLMRIVKTLPNLIDVVQNEYHIYNQSARMLDLCEELNIHFEAYACFGNPPKCARDKLPSCVMDPTVLKVAHRNSISVAQTIIKWIHSQPVSYVVKCDNKQQLYENLAAIGMNELDVCDLFELDSLNKRLRVYSFTEHKGLVRHPQYPFNEHCENLDDADIDLNDIARSRLHPPCPNKYDVAVEQLRNRTGGASMHLANPALYLIDENFEDEESDSDEYEMVHSRGTTAYVE